MINIYVGWDAREEEAYNVCVSSLKRRTSIPINVIPLIRSELESKKLYYRPFDVLAATEFTYTRFFVPLLNKHTGVGIFCDCDFLWLADINVLLNEIGYYTPEFNKKAAYVVKHDYTPKNNIKMDGVVQTTYPRKNWSSLIVWNCDHPKHRELNIECLNTASGAYLHRFQWLEDHEIGEINKSWNWLVDVYDNDSNTAINALHYTDGGPWFQNYKDCSYSELWYKEKNIISN